MSVSLEEPVRSRRDCFQVHSHSYSFGLVSVFVFTSACNWQSSQSKQRNLPLSLGMDHLHKNGFSNCFCRCPSAILKSPWLLNSGRTEQLFGFCNLFVQEQQVTRTSCGFAVKSPSFTCLWVAHLWIVLETEALLAVLVNLANYNLSWVWWSFSCGLKLHNINFMGFPSLLAWEILQQAKLTQGGVSPSPCGTTIYLPSLADGWAPRCHAVGLCRCVFLP